jgi:hypothetical protein
MRLYDGRRPAFIPSLVHGAARSGPDSGRAGGAGLRVEDLQATVDRLAADGYGLVGGIGQYENIWRMAYVRGPEVIIVSLGERIG